MYRKELEAALNAAKFPNHFLLYGADEYQIELFAKEILAKFKDFEILSFYYDEYDFDAARAHLCEPSLFGGSPLLHVKSDKKIPAKELKILIEGCKNGGAFVFELFESDAKAVFDTQKAFEVNFARFFKPGSPEEAVNLLGRQAAKMSLNITRNALFELYRIHNENLYLAASELNKLASLNEPINENIVRSLVFSLSSVSFDDFFDKFIALKDIRADFFSCADDGNFNEILFINSLYRAFFRLFKLHAGIKITGKFDIKETLGYTPPPNVANELKRQCLTVNLKAYKEIFTALNLAEFELKTNSALDKKTFLLSCVLGLQNLIGKNSKY